MSRPKHLFLMGCGRSGTTALATLLNGHERIALGIERYGNRFFRREFLDPSLFERERFFDLQEGDTFYSDMVAFNPRLYATLLERYDQATYRGDKIPLLYRFLPRLLDTFGEDCRVIFIFRNIIDVAASWEARADDPNDATWRAGRTAKAVTEWYQAIEAALRHAHDPRVLLVQFEQLFGVGEGRETLLDFLDLPPSPGMEETWEWLSVRGRELEGQRKRGLGFRELEHILRHAPIDRYRALIPRFGIALGSGVLPGDAGHDAGTAAKGDLGVSDLAAEGDGDRPRVGTVHDGAADRPEPVGVR